ncbi:MAG: hypothetical protein SFY80_12155 [Verrucomicrobiota bacterium]|nr:hypothetical protein [Verrucomicrobiota bacterium]
MFSRFKEINWHPDTAERKKLGRLMMLGSVPSGLWMLVLIWLSSKTWHWAIAAEVTAILLGIGGGICLFPSLARPVYVLWYGVVALSETLIVNLLLTLFYYLILTPAGFILRTISKDHASNPKRNAATYWKPMATKRPARSYYQQF